MLAPTPTIDPAARLTAWLPAGAESDGSVGALREVVPSAQCETAPASLDAQQIKAMAAHAPDFLLVDVLSGGSLIAELKRQLGDRTAIIGVGQSNDCRLYRLCLDLGALDYLPLPLTPDGVSDALIRATKLRAPVLTENETSRGIAIVLQAHGGAGASSVALNAAYLCAHEWGRNALLFDLDTRFGSSALALDLVPGLGLVEALAAPERVDGLFLASAVMPCSDNLSLLAAEADLEHAIGESEEAALAILDAARDSHDWIWIDMPRHAVPQRHALLAEADQIILVSERTLLGMRDCLRLAGLCRAAAPQARLHLVLNRCGRSKSNALTEKQFAAGAGLAVNATLPDESELFDKAAMAGKPVIAQAPKGRYSDALRALVGQIVGRAKAKPTPAWKQGLAKWLQTEQR